MQVKKYKRVNLENKRTVFFQLGLIVSLGAVLAAFEWGSEEIKVSDEYKGDILVEEEEMMPITRTKDKKVELPKLPKLLEQLVLVPDDVDVPDEELEIISEPLDEMPVFEMDSEEEEPGTFFVVEEMPEFPGGRDALMKFIASNVNYPSACAEVGISGKVYVSFVVNEFGKVTNVKVIRSPHQLLSKEAARVISGMPVWKPGKQRDKAVRVSYTVPVNFVLE